MSHHHEAPAAPAPAAPAKEPQLAARDKAYVAQPVPWKELTHHERKAVAHYAIGKGLLYAFPWVAAAAGWNASFYTKVPQAPSRKLIQAGVAFIGTAAASDLLVMRVKKPVRVYLTEHNSFLDDATLEHYSFFTSIRNRLRDVFGVHE